MPEAITVSQEQASPALLVKRASKRWVITAAITTAVVALPVLSVLDRKSVV